MQAIIRNAMIEAVSFFDNLSSNRNASQSPFFYPRYPGLEEFQSHFPLRGIKGGSHIVEGQFGQNLKQHPGDHLGEMCVVGASKESLNSSLSVKFFLVPSITYSWKPFHVSFSC